MSLLSVGRARKIKYTSYERFVIQMYLWAIVSMLLGFFLFSIGIYYSWISSTLDDVEAYELLSSIFGYSSYFFLTLGVVLVLFKILRKNNTRNQKRI